jgi:hypothetical protein
MRGSWGVAGTDAEAVERIVQNVTGVLEGRGSWMGLLGGFLNGSLLQGADIGGGGEGLGRISDRDRPRGRERGDDSYDDDDYDDRKRRRRRKEEPRERGVSRAQTWG